MPDFLIHKMLSTRPDLYCSQGQISGGCATHATAAALAVLGIVSSPSRIASGRSEPNARRLWAKLKDTYTDGLSFEDLAQRLRELQFPGLRIEHVEGTHFRVKTFAVTALQRRRPVILSFAPCNRARQLHAALGLGLSGRMQGRRFVPSAVLVTDSSAEPPSFGPVNARLEFSPLAKRERTALYSTAWAHYPVTIAGAISLHLAGSTSRELKPP
jgi:hypothetical protein